MIRTAPKPKPSITRQIEQAQASLDIWRELDEGTGDTIWHHKCSATFTYVEGDPQSGIRFTNWVRAHSRCKRGLCQITQEVMPDV